MATKGHWPKGRSRNLDRAHVAAGRRLADLLGRAISQGWRHPIFGVLSLRLVAGYWGVDHTTVHKWTRGTNLPPLWALDAIRALLKEFQP